MAGRFFIMDIVDREIILMPLSESVPKEPIHTRHIECQGYLREDGLWDIEGHLVDTKTYSFSNRHRGEIPPGEPVHEMWLRITIDDDMLIHKAEAATDYGPFHVCPAITPAFRRLEGLVIGPGFRQAVRQRLGGTEGCTHLVELAFSLGTAAFQTLAGRHHANAKTTGDDGTNSPKSARFIGTCHALASDSPVVKEHWPQHYTGSE